MVPFYTSGDHIIKKGHKTSAGLPNIPTNRDRPKSSTSPATWNSWSPSKRKLTVPLWAQPVGMHGVLICITFCLAVTWPKFRLDKKSLGKKSYLRKYSRWHYEIWSECGPIWYLGRPWRSRLPGQKWDFRSFSLYKGNVTMVKGHEGQGQSKAYDIRRWAHINVELHFFISTLPGMCKKNKFPFASDVKLYGRSYLQLI